ncbi:MULTISPECIES: sigma 54-interacting transcriptional regulator [Caproicibacterium]|uniref:Sigma 54-interacting transcriptional regulator n=1 Tax=Caproicibacterium argilliputei TaxID=3030016 RepID=A0AA97H1B1_9FIRM|nr:sigma-54-dependent transcriptional regulator [Caproicibacterium argilliputei]WOC32461.1 sigma 54-interacting transcriptional regulator [Caproicibacterium argilliputei]
MKRIDTVKQRLAELTGQRGISAGELAEDLGLSRANVSSDLNALCKAGLAEKYGSKPIYYKIAEATVCQSGELLLDAFVQSNHSLFHCVEEAKAAVLYPPHGMHMLFFGETGVGKSMFAELIYQYAHEKGCLAADGPFVDFNCADYADNPQLLLSQLMGAKKGAYTGADSDRPGLIEKADGGILFLDEVHRLPPQGQEMLFTFMDKGIYRRLGETDAQRSATVLLICATTEDPGSNLLKTFVRRIPMVIKIPSLSERSTDERLNLISTFFTAESARLGKPISVSVNSVRSLLSYPCPNNIGQLKNDIQILCARAYSDYVSGKKDELCIVSLDLPDAIRKGLFSETSHRDIWKRYIGMNKRFCVFDSTAKTPLFTRDESSETIYDMIDERMRELKNAHASEQEIEKELNSDIELYFQKYISQEAGTQSFSNLKNLVGMKIIYAADEILSQASRELTRAFQDDVRYGLSIHIYNSINRVQRGRKIVNPQLNNMRKRYPKEFSAALKGLAIINDQFDVEMPIDEAGFLAAFFNIDCLGKRAKVRVIVIAHGSSTAASMAETANRLLGFQDAAIGINALLDESPQAVYHHLKDYLHQHPAESGLLLLVDMGSLLNFAPAVQKELGTPTKAIPLVSTLHVVEAARKASLGYSLEEIYRAVMRIQELSPEGAPALPSKERLARIFIISICTTGEGSAALIKNILDSQLNYHGGICETIALKLTDFENIRERLETISKIGRIICIISSFDVGFPVAHYRLSEVIDGNALTKIQKTVDQECTLENISGTFSTMLKNADGPRLLAAVRKAVEGMEQKSGCTLTPDVKIGLYCHMGCMVDRLLSNGTLRAFPGKEAYRNQNEALLHQIKEACVPLTSAFQISISEDEFCYLSKFFTEPNCVHPA